MRTLVAVLILLLACPAARAAPSSLAAAKAAYEEGMRAYLADRFIDAAESFERAYKLQPRALMLFNIAQCYRKSGAFERALQNYEAYLAIGKDSEAPQTVVEAQGYVNDLKRYLDKLRGATVTPPPPAPAPNPQAQPSAEATPTPATVNLVAEQAAPPAKHRPLVRSPWLWTGVGLGVVVVLAVGLGVGLTRPSDPKASLGTQTPVYP